MRTCAEMSAERREKLTTNALFIAMSTKVFLLAFLCILQVLLAYRSPGSPVRRVGRWMMSTEAPKEPEWVGAKKFSFKDRDIKSVFTNEQIAKILPHRYPFLLVDKVVEFEPGKRAVGVKCITANEPQFTGHFPNRPIMPGVLQIEAMAQLGIKFCIK